MNPSTPVHPAPGRFDGWTCPACQGHLRAGDPIAECTTCGAPHHAACWERAGACRAYDCLPAAGGPAGRSLPAPRGTADAPGLPEIVIRSNEVKDVDIEEVSTRSAAGTAPIRIARFVERRHSRLAAWAFGLGIGGVVLAGFPGIFAVVLGAIALGSILNDRRLKGAWMAATGIVLGMLSTAGWLLAAIFIFWKPEPGHSIPSMSFSGVPNLKDAPAEIRPMLLANVRITGSSGSLVGRKEWLGSGVVYQIEGRETVLITNRHVADPDFAEGRSGAELPEVDLKVTFANGETVPGRVDWVAPGGIDLALVKCSAPSPGTDAPKPPPHVPVRRPKIGETLFAIGNPEGLGWSYTQGVVSSLRTLETEGGEVIVIQTQTPLNPGNSGGGLYDKDGNLVGINTWTRDKMATEGLNFAISMETVDRLLQADGKAR
ncbi:MAG: trypsin-like peptidase domain-containing protein [Planctomycetes bacterium]|nr:trypsin-like peptidase domain-containing protein [Planctomycetota bacterium]